MLQHYTRGSKYNTKFWEYAKALSKTVQSNQYDTAMRFATQWHHLDTEQINFGMWGTYNLKNWYDNVLND